MSTLLQVSDTHFGTEQAPVVEALLAFGAQARPDLVVLSGDITQRARAAQFAAARAFVDRLGAPCLAVPGNHDLPLFDLWRRWRDPYRGYRQAFGDVLEPVHERDDLLVLGLNTTRAHRHKHGELSPEQVDRVAARLGQARAMQLRVVVVHQPIAAVRDEDRVHLLRGHAAALARWSDAGADVVLGGHIHLPYVTRCVEDPRPLWAVQAGTAVSRRVRPGVPNSVNLLRWEPASRLCLVERWDFDAVNATFSRAEASPLWPARGGAATARQAT